jgi:hypothetical protein
MNDELAQRGEEKGGKQRLKGFSCKQVINYETNYFSYKDHAPLDATSQSAVAWSIRCNRQIGGRLATPCPADCLIGIAVTDRRPLGRSSHAFDFY